MATFSVLTGTFVLEDAPADVSAELAVRTTPDTMLKYLQRKLHSAGSGMQRSRFHVRNDSVTTGSTHEAGEHVSLTYTITHANVDATETLVIGGTELEWVAASANEDEVTIGADLAEDVTNMVAAINEHSELNGLFLATGVTATGVVTITYLGDPRIGRHILASETGDAGVLSATSFVADTTDAYSSPTYSFTGMGIE
jgi:hypothetical protein